MDILIGCSGFPYSKKNYFNSFSFVEYQDSYKTFVKRKTLEKLRSQAGENFSFALKAPIFLTDSKDFITRFSKNVPQIDPENIENYGMFKNTDQNSKILDLLYKEAKYLKGDAIVFYTSNKIYPTPENIRNINTFFRSIKDYASENSIDLFWHALGFWEKETILEAIEGTDAYPAYDPLMDGDYGDFDVNYFVMRALGNYANGYPDGALERVAEIIDEKSTDTYVTFLGPYQASDAKRLKDIVTTS